MTDPEAFSPLVWSQEGPVRVPVRAEHQVVIARQAAAAAAAAVGLGPVRGPMLVTAVSELAWNLVVHARRGGVMTLGSVKRDGRVGLQAVAEDAGPGIADLESALCDGFSTCGGLGGGLPGARRLTDEFEIWSDPGVGTRVRVVAWRPPR